MATSSSPSSRAHKTLSLAERIDVIKRMEDKKESQESVAKHYGVHRSQISRILKQKDQLLHDWQNNTNLDRKRKRTGKAEDVEQALLRWFAQARSRQLPISGPLLMEKAAQLAEGLGIQDFKATVGWLERWKERNNIKFKKQHGEKQDADDFVPSAGLWRCCQALSGTLNPATSLMLTKRVSIGEPLRMEH